MTSPEEDTWSAVRDKITQILDFVANWLALNKHIFEYKQNRVHNVWKLQK